MGTPMKQFQTVSPIGEGDTGAVPVKELDRAIRFYTHVLGFALVSKDQRRAELERDDVQIGLLVDEHHDPEEAGSFYFGVSDVEALRRELESKGGKPGATEIQQHQEKNYRVFFLRECDMLDSHDGYCFCFGQPA
jgi:catechol 2,3-dioxygenase-like lactoylglutathione lyase family enzyme